MEEGADFFFDKSTEFEKVPEVIRKLLQDSKHLQWIRRSQ